MEQTRGIIWPFFASLLLLQLCGCEWGGKSYWLGKYESHIRNGTRSIESARSDAQRAAGHDERGRGYAEKARYSRVFKLIGAEEYTQLFDLALKDHADAVRLDPGNAEMYVSRGRTYYDRAAAAGQDDVEPKAEAKQWFDLAKADFTKAIERDGRHELAFDMRGMIHENGGEYERAIDDYTHVMSLNPRLGRVRLADLYCGRGNIRQREKKYDLAVSDYEKSIELGAPTDGCNCDPYAPLAWTYFDGLKQYDKTWEIVHKAQGDRRWIPPELVEELKKTSGRNR